MRHLVYPLKTVLDDSIGCAVWFAAKGKGIVGNGPNRGAKYTSTARVMFGVHTVLPFLWSVRHEACGGVKILAPPPHFAPFIAQLWHVYLSVCAFVFFSVASDITRIYRPITAVLQRSEVCLHKTQ